MTQDVGTVEAAIASQTVAPATTEATATTEAPKTETTTQTQAPAKDPAAATRYQITREREKAAAIAKEFEDYKAKMAQPQQKFDPTNDPDGTKEIEAIAERKAMELMEKRFKELGLEEKVAELRYEKEQDQFFSVVESQFDAFKKLGITPPTRAEMLETMTVINEKGITPDQLIAIARHEEIISKLKPA